MEQKYLFECENCGVKFVLGPNGVELKYGIPFTTEDGRSIFITYYDCPCCSRRHYVQIDDARSYQIKKDTSKIFKRLSKKRLDFKDITKEQNEKFKKLNRKLEDYRNGLKKEFDGKIVYSEEGVQFELHFSV